MNLGLALAKIPWKEIVKAIPILIDGSRRLYESIKKNKKDTNDLNSRVCQIENNQAEQSALIVQIANNSKDFSESLRILDARAKVSFWVSIVALIIVFLLIVKELFT